MTHIRNATKKSAATRSGQPKDVKRYLVDRSVNLFNQKVAAYAPILQIPFAPLGWLGWVAADFFVAFLIHIIALGRATFVAFR